jgi:hypothetical protein
MWAFLMRAIKMPVLIQNGHEFEETFPNVKYRCIYALDPSKATQAHLESNI